MYLVDTAEWERMYNALVYALHCICILLVEWALMLIDHDAVLFQCLEAVPVELLREKTFPRSEWICRVYDNEVVCVDGFAYEAQSVLIVDVNALIRET